MMGCKRARGTEQEADFVSAVQSTPAGSVPRVAAATAIEAGRYIVRIAGCNDCHTMGYDQALGQIPEADWLTGMAIGFRGPWGTSYAANLRLRVQEMSEDTWVQMLHTRKAMPPMPWPSVNSLSEQDARAVYQFIKSLGPKGESVPVPVPPDQEPATPYILFDPLHMERLD
jgi:mono/diheme cytochrome c family protein